ncbi:TetR/AcrR family transcriptional regulator, partial [Enterococcus faecium]
IYIYSYFNLFYQKKLLLYLSLYQQDKETTEFEEDLLKYLKILVKKRLIEIE